MVFIKTFRFFRLFYSLKYFRYNCNVLQNLNHFKTFSTNSKSKTFSLISSKQSFRGNTLWSWNIVSGLLVWLGIIEDFDSTESPLILTIKRGLQCMQCEDYGKAELILHSALQMAQDLTFESAETYILDVLANNYFMKQDFKRAEQLFVEVFNRVMSKGMKPNEEPIIEISIKLSHIFSLSSHFDECEKGFDFCLTEQNKRVENLMDKCLDELNKEEVNSLALFGMCCDYYAKHLSSIGKYDKAIENYEKALNLCTKINGETHPQTLVLLNDMSNTYVHKKDFESALNCLKRAIDGAIQTEDKNLANFYLNIGSLYLIQFNKDLALRSCRQSLALTLQSKDQFLEAKARHCMSEAR